MVIKTKKKGAKKITKDKDVNFLLKFDPVINVDSGESKREQVVWSTQVVDAALKGIELGKPLKANPFFNNKPPFRRGDIVYQYTDWEIMEKAKCISSIEYFASTYGKLKDDSGRIKNVTLRDYQLDQLLAFDDVKLKKHILLWSRQSAKTTTTALYFVYRLLFDIDANFVVLANKLDTAKEVINKIFEIYANLPFWLQNGVLGMNNKGFALDNNCKVFCRPTTMDSLNGLSCKYLYCDEFSFTFDGDREKQSDFLSNARPVLRSFKDNKMIISSTPNGRELFCEIFDKAVLGKNGFHWSKVYWWQIPGTSIEWANDERATIGEDKFKVQYELSFDVETDRLLSPKAMLRLSKNDREYDEDVYNYEIFEAYSKYIRFKPNAEIDWKKDYFISSIDLGEGLEEDATTIQFFRIRHIFRDRIINNKIEKIPIIWLEQVAVWESDDISIDDFANILGSIANVFDQWNMNNKFLVEGNKLGEWLFKCCDTLEDDNTYIDSSNWFKFHRSLGSKKKVRGLFTNRAIKKIGVKAYKKCFELNAFSITDSKTIDQVTNFQENPKKIGTYSALIGHDDLVTPLINLSFLLSLNDSAFRTHIDTYLEENNVDYEQFVFAADLSKIINKYTNLSDDN